MLTKRDLVSGPPYLVVGVRADGSRLILHEAHSHGESYRTQQTLKSFLEDYAAVLVERAGERSDEP